MRANRHHDQRRRRERRRLARIAVLKEVEAGPSPVSLFNSARPHNHPNPRRKAAPRGQYHGPPSPSLIWRAGDKVHWQGYIGMFFATPTTMSAMPRC